MKQTAIIAFSAFIVYCGYSFGSRTTSEHYEKVIEQKQIQIDSLKRKHSKLVDLNREHYDRCRFNYYNK